METHNPKAQKMSSQIFPSPDISLNNEKYFFGYSRIGNQTNNESRNEWFSWLCQRMCMWE